MPEFHDSISAKDGGVIEITPNQPQPKRKEYTVVKSLFKNGKLYKKGTKVELDEQTAKNFKRLGEIE